MRAVRRAKPEDAQGIHEAHMRSIREVCSKDYSAEEVKAWGFRPFQVEHRINTIKNQFVWVVDNAGTIEGYGHFGLQQEEGRTLSSIYGLYLAPEIVGMGFGRQIVMLMIAEAKKAGTREINLESSLTAHSFYQRLGFQNSGPLKKVQISGVGVRCYPMSRAVI